MKTIYLLPLTLFLLFSVVGISGNTGRCRAVFEATKDSGNQVQNFFLFHDLSEGNPAVWTWDFGDGTTCKDRNPKHQYQSQGTFRVMLTITTPDSGGGQVCSDTTSRIVTTCNYFNAGGLLFAGKYPINNPVNTGDTGVAYLYRVHNKWVAPVDTVKFTYLGYYTFLNLPEGSYIIKAGLSRGSLRYGLFISTYYDDNIDWQSAKVFSVQHNIYDNNIHLIAANDSITGACSISGTVKHGDDNTLIPSAEVILFTRGMAPLRSITTNSKGFFEFSGLPYGSYTIYPEMAGKFTNPLNLTFDSVHPALTCVNLVLYNHEMMGIPPVGQFTGIRVGKAFPNPIHGDFSVQMISAKIVTLIAQIRTMTGEVLQEQKLSLTKGTGYISLSVKNASPGMFFLVFTDENGRVVNCQKIIKN